MKSLIRFFLILLVVCAAIGVTTSCSEDNNCSMGGRDMINGSLFRVEPVSNKTVNDTLDSLTVTALGTDSIIINNMKKVHTLALPLRFTEESTVLVFHYDFKRRPGYADTVYINHRNTPYFQSMECGYTMKQAIQHIRVGNGKVIGNVKMDSIKVINPNANINETQNLQLFFRFRDRTIH
ncbi:DUF6452 family protein [Bacteroides sp.]|uniref:DUF6452 family protein n=1 Tax=Bacteroides sp. TaxID=29523 RepID=UPI001B487892|nr:DUF6452 family protein [Bacteroides sp.]MBP6066376.1 calcium-binding protein P [Bacteroides sp.]MBP6068599.1 calcium-binding protein P [Bacteroides sp.]MBP6937487.1 calcium-binding protein P [Bacteroides sp.]MBP8623046.1 calcium-binding protein P [Bacteroides sp.]MBP9586586.1 calcium-binding protein P [Bacteroides sp.]